MSLIGAIDGKLTLSSISSIIVLCFNFTQIQDLEAEASRLRLQLQQAQEALVGAQQASGNKVLSIDSLHSPPVLSRFFRRYHPWCCAAESGVADFESKGPALRLRLTRLAGCVSVMVLDIGVLETQELRAELLRCRHMHDTVLVAGEGSRGRGFAACGGGGQAAARARRPEGLGR